MTKRRVAAAGGRWAVRAAAILAGAAGVMVAASGLAWGAVDTTAPLLGGLTFTPATVSISGANATVNGAIQASDDSSGLASATIAFYSPSGARRVDCMGTSSSYSGTLLAGTFTCTATVARYTETGVWVVKFVEVKDKAGNTLRVETAALAARGSVTTLTVTGTSDLTAPALTTYAFSPTSVTPTTSPVTITGVIQATDNLAGLYEAYLAFYSPSGNQRVDCHSPVGDAGSGTPTNGAFYCSGTFLPSAEAGTWTVKFAYISDKAGNAVMIPTATLQARGLAVTLTVGGAGDTQPPTLTGYSWAPATVDLSVGAVTVNGIVAAADNISGLKNAVIGFLSPVLKQRVECLSVGAATAALSGLFNCVATFPANAEDGVWTVQFVSVTDKTGNTGLWDTSQLTALGLPVAITVTHVSAPVIPPSLTFNYTITDANPESKVIVVSGGVRPWNYSVTTAVSWMTVTAYSGALGGGLTVAVNPVALPVGTYTTSIRINDTGGVHPAATVPVKLVVAPDPWASAGVSVAWPAAGAMAEMRAASGAVGADVSVMLLWP